MEVVILEENCFLIKKSYNILFPIHSFSPLFIRNQNQFLVNSEVYHIDTKQHANFHQLSVNLTKYQKGVYYVVEKVFNKLPML